MRVLVTSDVLVPSWRRMVISMVRACINDLPMRCESLWCHVLGWRRGAAEMALSIVRV